MHAPSKFSQNLGFHYSFRDFIESGGDEGSSPFLKPQARLVARWLRLPLALISALLLIAAWGLCFSECNHAYVLSLIACVYFLSGTRALYNAIGDLSRMTINIDVLMTLAAYLCLITDAALEGGLLLVLFDISRNLERLVTLKARSSLMSLRNLAPEKAWFIPCFKDDEPKLSDPQQLRHIKDITPGSYIAVKAGELVPLDGIIVDGSGNFSMGHLTGEPLPVHLSKGQEVPSGARTLESPVLLRVLRPAHEATLTRIIRLIHEAQDSKPRLQRLFDEIGDNYAKGVILASALIAIGLPWITPMSYIGVEGSIYRALAFMIAASPCALILAVPIAYLSALSACARQGILLKAGSALDLLASCRRLALDKTGTLTLGRPVVSAIDIFGKEPAKLRAATLAVERQAKHPLAEAIVEHLSEDVNPNVTVSNIELHLGYGMSALLDDEPMRVGRSSWAIEIADPSFKTQVCSRLESLKETETYSLACTRHSAILFSFQDQLRPGAAQVIKELSQNIGFTIYMLTGDHEASALAIAKEVGLNEVHHSLKPNDKLDWIRKLGQTEPLAMVGDGINDAPALAGATVGIAMGGIGSAAATTAADVLLLHDDLGKLPWLFLKARQTRRIIWQNLILAASVVLIASMSALFGFIPLWAAVIAHEGGTVLVGLNGLRLIRSKGH